MFLIYIRFYNIFITNRPIIDKLFISQSSIFINVFRIIAIIKLELIFPKFNNFYYNINNI